MRLQATTRGGGENWLLLFQVQWPPPLVAAEAGRYASIRRMNDGKSRKVESAKKR